MSHSNKKLVDNDDYWYNSSKSSRRENRQRQETKGTKSNRLLSSERENLYGLLQRIGVSDDWDFLLFGDGSGSTWNKECGWAAVSIERLTMERLVWYGYANRGSVNLAELMAYLQPLSWLANREADRIKKYKRRRDYQVQIVTDSQYCANTGNSNDRMMIKNGPLWAQFDCLKRQGIAVNWLWWPRGGAELNSYADALSRLARVEFRKYNLPERLATNTAGEIVTTVYDCNPDE